MKQETFNTIITMAFFSLFGFVLLVANHNLELNRELNKQKILLLSQSEAIKSQQKLLIKYKE